MCRNLVIGCLEHILVAHLAEVCDLLCDILYLPLVDRSFVLLQGLLCELDVFFFLLIKLLQIVVDIIFFELWRLLSLLKIIFVVIVSCVGDPHNE